MGNFDPTCDTVAAEENKGYLVETSDGEIGKIITWRQTDLGDTETLQYKVEIEGSTIWIPYKKLQDAPEDSEEDSE